MTYQKILEQARTCIGNYCKACSVCNGKACTNSMPGPGAKGFGDTAVRNFEKWQEIRLNMDTLTEEIPADTTFHLFGKTFEYPFFAGPIGSINPNYGEKHNNQTYNDILVPACAEAGIASFTGDGMDPDILKITTNAVKKAHGTGIPTLKPWKPSVVRDKLTCVHQSGAFAVAMDVDAAGLPFPDGPTPHGRRSTNELREIIQAARIPFIVKGIMTVKGAEKAIEAGASAIVVSNHGGRVLDHCPATAEVLEEIAAAVDGRIKVFVDGGIRSGTDVFKALAMGADGVLICRPFVAALYGGGSDGVKFYIKKIGAELKNAMEMCGANNLAEITRDMIR